MALCYRLQSAIYKNDTTEVSKILCPNDNRPGRRPHLRPVQQTMIVKRLLFAARRGFAADNEDLKQMMAKMAELNGCPYKNGLPTNDTVRVFRAKHKDIAYRDSESKDRAKLNAENYEHVEKLFEIIETVHEIFPYTKDLGNLVWNMDETAIDSEYGRRRKVFTDASSHHGGARASVKSAGGGKHITLVVAASAAGNKCPPFFIIQGVKVMENWLAPFEIPNYPQLRLLS